MTSPTATTAQRVQVRAIRLEADDIVSVELASTDRGTPLPAWSSGAHIDVVLPSGLIRQYSLCGDPAERHVYRIAVLRQEAGRGGSVELHDTVRVGQLLDIHGPRNHFPLSDETGHLFVAGGIGITPILTHVRAAHERGDDWKVVYGARSAAAMAFVDELERLDPERVRLVPEDASGRIDLDRVLAEAPEGWDVFCCGPSGLLNAAVEKVPASRLRIERFAASGNAAAGSDSAFEVVLKRSELTLGVPPGQSILDAAMAAGIEPLWSCNEGLCGTCQTTVLEGEPEHLDDILSDDERAANTQMMICVSRSKSPRLVLDL